MSSKNTVSCLVSTVVIPLDSVKSGKSAFLMWSSGSIRQSPGNATAVVSYRCLDRHFVIASVVLRSLDSMHFTERHIWAKGRFITNVRMML